MRPLFLSGSLLLAACAGSPTMAPATLPVTIQQGERSTTLTQDQDSVTLRRETFSLYFDNQPYNSEKEQYHAAQVVVATNPQTLAGIQVGLKTVDSPYLEPGSGLAGTETGYDAVLPDAEGAHYLYYNTPSDHRVELLHPNPDGTQRLEWQVSKLTVGGQDVPVAETRLPALHFAVFVDHNLNEQIEAGELTRLTVLFAD